MSSREAAQLVQDLFDGIISRQDFARLEEKLNNSPVLQEHYREAALLHTTLELRGHALTHPGEHPNVVPIDTILRQRQRRALTASLIATAALLVALAVTLHFILAPNPEPQFAVQTSPDSHYTITHSQGLEDVPEVDTLAVGSSIDLTQGTLELLLAGDVRAVVSAPSKFTLSTETRLDFTEGTVWLHVPPGAEGFQVATPRMIVTDLGTEFGVISVPGSTDEVHVFDGEVEVQALRGEEKALVLKAGRARQVTKFGTFRKIPSDELAFHKALPKGLPYLHFGFESIVENSLRIDGNHPALPGITNELKQSDGRPAAERLVDGRFGKGLEFNGLGDFVQTNWPGVYGTSPLTIACWVKHSGIPTAGGWVGWGASKEYTELPHQWKILLKAGGKSKHLFRCSWGTQDIVDAPFHDEMEEWHHFAVVFSGGSPDEGTTELRFYVDGKRVRPTKDAMPRPPKRPPTFVDAQPLTLGYGLRKINDLKKQFFRGVHDEVYIIEGALSDRQIRNLYRSNRYRPEVTP